MNLQQAAWFSAVPWGTMAISGYIAGAISDFLIKSGKSITVTRKIMQVILRIFRLDRSQVLGYYTNRILTTIDKSIIYLALAHSIFIYIYVSIATQYFVMDQVSGNNYHY